MALGVAAAVIEVERTWGDFGPVELVMKVRLMDSMRTELSVSYSSPQDGPAHSQSWDKCWKNEGVKTEGQAPCGQQEGTMEVFPGCKVVGSNFILSHVDVHFSQNC